MSASSFTSCTGGWLRATNGFDPFMPIQLNSPDWKVKRLARSRGTAGLADVGLPGLPTEFLAADSRVAEEVVLEPAPATRGRDGGGAGLDFNYEIEPGQAAVLAIRQRGTRSEDRAS